MESQAAAALSLSLAASCVADAWDGSPQRVSSSRHTWPWRPVLPNTMILNLSCGVATGLLLANSRHLHRNDPVLAIVNASWHGQRIGSRCHGHMTTCLLGHMPITESLHTELQADLTGKRYLLFHFLNFA